MASEKEGEEGRGDDETPDRASSEQEGLSPLARAQLLALTLQVVDIVYRVVDIVGHVLGGW